MDIFPEIASLQCSWVKRLYDASFHAWEVIPLFLIKNNLGKKFELTRRVTLNTNFRIFRYKLLHNILYLNEMLYKFGYPHFALFAWKSLKAQVIFFILV